jgi:hypothetical protein
MGTALQIVSTSSDVCVAVFRNALLANFRRRTPASAVDLLHTAARSIPRGERVVFFAVIKVDSDAPDNEGRARFTQFFEDHADRLACAIITYRGEGFRGATVRTIVNGIFHLMPRFRFAFPRHVVGSIEEAAALASKYSSALDATTLLAAFDEMRAK